MTRVKKSRKTGPLAPSKADKKPWETPKGKPSSGKATRKSKGHQPGSRFNPNMGQQSAGRNSQPALQDPRHGSKKPIPLVTLATATDSKPLVAQDAAYAELQALENDARLHELLDKIDQEIPLTDAEQAYVDECTERFAELADQLGLDLDDDEDDEEDDD